MFQVFILSFIKLTQQTLPTATFWRNIILLNLMRACQFSASNYTCVINTNTEQVKLTSLVGVSKCMPPVIFRACWITPSRFSSTSILWNNCLCSSTFIALSCKWSPSVNCVETAFLYLYYFGIETIPIPSVLNRCILQTKILLNKACLTNARIWSWIPCCWFIAHKSTYFLRRLYAMGFVPPVKGIKWSEMPVFASVTLEQLATTHLSAFFRFDNFYLRFWLLNDNTRNSNFVGMS